jgi:putative serine protease XkdF
VAEINFQFEVLRKDEQRRRVFGWFSIANDKDGKAVIDRHGDVIDVETLEAAAAEFVKEWRQGGQDHAGGAPHKLVASMVFTRELQKSLGIPDGTLPEGWFGGFEIDEAAFKRLAKGELLMFSIEGEAVTEMVEVPA